MDKIIAKVRIVRSKSFKLLVPYPDGCEGTDKIFISGCDRLNGV